MIQAPRDGLLFSVAGARGIVGKGINVEVVTRLTLAFCSVLPPGPVVVGRDTRPSGESFLFAVCGAVTGSGRECINLGIATTPTVEMMVERLGGAGGIIVTASHNPVEWNALKFLDARGVFITKGAADRLQEVFHGERFEYADGISTGHASSHDRAARDHIDAIMALHAVDVERIIRRRFKVVIDCINGAGSVIAPDLLMAFGVKVIPMNCATDGDFRRDPEPRAENLVELGERVKREGADLGFALDPDADRLALADDAGTPLSEEYTLALAVDHVLETGKRGPVVVNASTSALIDWIAAQHRAAVMRTPVGEAHVVDRMLREKAPIGGEGNGGVIYPELHPGRDGLVGMALILQLLADRGAALSKQVARYPRFSMRKQKIPLGGEFSTERISDLIRSLGPVRIEVGDGIKAIFDDGWCHIRVSNTEGVVRVITESMSEERTAGLQAGARGILDKLWSR